MSQYSQLFLKRMSTSKKSNSSIIHIIVPLNARKQSIPKLITKMCKLLHLNELEIVAWSLWIDENNWNENDTTEMSMENFLFITSLQIKVCILSRNV